MSRGAELRRQLARLAPSLRVVAHDVLAESSRIDVVAIDAQRAAIAVFDAEGDDLATFTRALASAAWLEARLPDWCQIAPDLKIDTIPSGCLSLDLAPETLAAARRLGTARIALLRPNAPVSRTLLHSARPPAPQRPPARPRKPFRTGLTDADLGFDESRS